MRVPVHPRRRSGIGVSRCRGGHQLAGGSATLEFLGMMPFMLILMALVWDLNEYASNRTELARSTYVLTEMIANHTDGNPIEGLVGPFKDRMAEGSAGAVRVAVVTRGAAQGECDDENGWCRPMVALRWPPQAQAELGEWGGGGDCAGGDSAFPARLALPREGTEFSAAQKVLPNEGASGADEPDWLSRNLTPEDWLVLLDVCFDPPSGRLAGRLATGWTYWELFDTSPYVIKRRAGWASVHALAACDWCRP